MSIKTLSLAAVSVLFGGLVQGSFASIITNGTFTMTGTIFVVNNGTSAATLAANGGVGLPTCASAGGCIYWLSSGGTSINRADIATSGLPSGNIPTAISGNDAAAVSNLTNPTELVGSPGFTPQPFISFLNGGVTTALMIDFIAAGVNGSAGCAAAVAATNPPQMCTPAGSLFNFVNNPNPLPPPVALATATWVFSGVTSGNPNPQQVWFGNFTSQFNIPFQQVLANLAAVGFVSDTYSGTITLAQNPVPEPGSLLMIGSGLVGLAAFLRRRKAI